MALYEIRSDQVCEMTPTTFAALKLRERGDMQRIIRERIGIIAPDTLVIAEEFGDWEDSQRRIDLLLLDKDANLVVVELKRTEDGGHMDLQAIRYAAMVSTMTFRQAVEAHRVHLAKVGSLEVDAMERILAFLGWAEPDEDRFAQAVRIILVSGGFSREITTSVLWLNEQGLDIRCIRLLPYTHDGATLLDVEQLLPLPEAEAYQVRVREKVAEEREARQAQSGRGERYKRFWTGLLAKANARTNLHRSVSASKESWISATQQGLSFAYVVNQSGSRIELYIDRQDPVENTAILHALQAHQSDIERAYGEPLSWQPLEGKKACRIAATILGDGSLLDESTWDALQGKLVDSMVSFEKALAPHIAAFRDVLRASPG